MCTKKDEILKKNREEMMSAKVANSLPEYKTVMWIIEDELRFLGEAVRMIKSQEGAMSAVEILARLKLEAIKTACEIRELNSRVQTENMRARSMR